MGASRAVAGITVDLVYVGCILGVPLVTHLVMRRRGTNAGMVAIYDAGRTLCDFASKGFHRIEVMNAITAEELMADNHSRRGSRFVPW
jgi:hypothetical protein